MNIEFLNAHLAKHQFRTMFVDELGWDRANHCIEFEINERPFQYHLVAHKRGFAVIVGEQHRTVLADRHYLRRIQKQIARSHHEHILIHYCSKPMKQVWQWAIRSTTGNQLRHREHPFFSSKPPIHLVKRLQQLGFSLAEEDNITLIDALERVRSVLDRDSEFELFSKWPSFAKRSDALATAMRDGLPGAFHAFVEFHMPLARNSSRMILRWFPWIDPDDASQIAMMGLLEAAKRFEPDRGCQFSTYANYWIYQCCKRYSPDNALPIRLPAHCIWECYRAEFDRQKLIATYGEERSGRRFGKRLSQNGIKLAWWRGFCASRDMRMITDIERDEYFEIREQIDEVFPTPFQQAIENEHTLLLSQAMQLLPERHALVLELRYGIGCREHTLEEAGEILKVTRERIRQIQKRAEKILASRLHCQQLEFFETEIEDSKYKHEAQASDPETQTSASEAQDRTTDENDSKTHELENDDSATS